MIILKIKDYGTIKFELRFDCAPLTCAHIEKLVKEGFYDGLIFHRVINGFMIQGGDPTGTGFGDPSQEKIVGEFAANGIDNPLRHKRGVLSMARSQMMNSASSQFFICQADCYYLDCQYAAFGEVKEGIEVVDKIAQTKTDLQDRPIKPVVIEKMYIED